MCLSWGALRPIALLSASQLDSRPVPSYRATAPGKPADRQFQDNGHGSGALPGLRGWPGWGMGPPGGPGPQPAHTHHWGLQAHSRLPPGGVGAPHPHSMSSGKPATAGEARGHVQLWSRGFPLVESWWAWESCPRRKVGLVSHRTLVVVVGRVSRRAGGRASCR